MTSSVEHRSSISRIRRQAISDALALAIVLVSVVVAISSAQAQTFSVLYAFKGGADGTYPQSGLVLDSGGNLHSTTYWGGSSNCSNGCGTVFELDATGKETVLHTFADSPDGAYPAATLVGDAAGNLYGTTQGGGANRAGTVFKLDNNGKSTVLYSFSFTGGDGYYPVAGLLRDAAGNLYGTTSYGGAYGSGTVFKLDKNGMEVVLHSFGKGTDGRYPLAALVWDAAGNLYGTTVVGGAYGYGTVFKLDKSDNDKETVVYSFTGGEDGGEPYAGLIGDSKGSFYGTTFAGGVYGYGTVFKLDKNGKERVLHSFGNVPDGAYPQAALVRDAAGNLYGTTVLGGSGCGGFCGVVFKLGKTRRERVLYAFSGADGAQPYSALVRDAKGNLYGTASQGGDFNCTVGGLTGCGVVFKLTP